MDFNKLFITSLLTLILGAIPYSGTSKNSSTWQKQFVRLKEQIRNSQFEGQAPVVTDIIRYRQSAQKLVMNLTDVDTLDLETNGSANGTEWDHAVFGNPTLIDLNGNRHSLTELTPIFAKGAEGTPIYNKNFAGKALQINGKVYEKGILLHANGKISYRLDNNYKQIEVEVGIEDRSNPTGSVIFTLRDTRYNYRKLLATLSEEASREVVSFAQKQRISTESLLSKGNADVEKQALLATIADFPDKSFFLNTIKNYDLLSIDEQIEKYLSLADLAVQVAKVTTELEWINLKALSAYMEDVKNENGFNYPKQKAIYDQIIHHYPIVMANLYRKPKTYLAQAQELIKKKKQLILANPTLNMDRIIISRYKLGDVARTLMAPALGMPSNNWSSMYSASTTSAAGEIAELSNLQGDIQIRTIYQTKENRNLADLQIHWSGEKLLFSSLDDRNHWQVYEIGVDGKDFKQKIQVDEPDLQFCDANYLPDGRIIASSNIGYQGVPCVNGSDKVGNLTLYDPKSQSLRRLTFDQDGNWNPIVMHNGRVMYTRWEYTDLTHYFSRIVMHMNPDGTENKALYGSGSFWPNSTFDIKPIPNHPSQFIGIISGHHGIARSGRLMIFDPVKSRKEEKGVVQELPFKDRIIIPEVKDELVNGVWPQFVRPCPINEKYFLVSAKLTPKSLWGIYLVDVFDNLTCIAEFEGEGLNTPLIPTKRPAPPTIPDRIKPTDKEATIFIQDIYEGEGTEGVPRGTIKELRIMAYEYAYWNSVSDHDAQGIQSGWDIKRLLGTVPVEEDGSVIFKVPANTPISIQPLDDKGRALQWMRSWFTPMPGETVSCIGCHEDQNQIPIPKRTIASQRKPHPLKAPEGGVRSFTYELEIQPILDRTCIACHNEKNNINLTGGRIDHTYPRNKRFWSKSYLAIMPYVYRQGPEAEMYVLKPYEYHASNSELIRLLENGHHGVTLTEKEWKTLYNWIDFNAPYHGVFHNITKANGFDQYDRRIELANKYNNGAGVDWRAEIKAYESYLKQQGEIETVMPKDPKPIKTREPKLSNWPFTSQVALELQQEKGETRKTVEIAPGVEMNFVWIPAGKFIMGTNHAEPNCRPLFRTEVKEGFWMSECEVTNEQYCALIPEHDSRIIGQFWKDHTTAGYPANKPQQPVIRVNCEEALQYCEQLSNRLKLNITLPTEIQWEWACRGGSDQPFWYGDHNTDFGKFENMADYQLTDMAVTGVDPKPLPKDHRLREYWDYIPKIKAVNDGEMLTAFVGGYEANPWGLKDMHGNVAEWTKSDYVSYPLKQTQSATHKVVRGGSWTDRPKYAASYSRKAFLPWQKIYNVGFRIIIEE